MAFVKYVLLTAGIGAAYVGLSGGNAGGQTFAQPVDVALHRLAAKSRVVEGTGFGSLTLESAGSEEGAIFVRIKRAGDPVSVKCRVAISASSPATSRAVVDCTQPDTGDKAARRLGANALAIAVRAHVAATIEDRPYEIDKVANGMMAFLVLNRPAIAAMLSSPSGRH